MNVNAFKKYLKNQSDSNLALDLISDGFRLHLITDNTPFTPQNLSQKVANHATSKREIIKIIDQITKELKSGAIEPSEIPPKCQINLFCVPKKDSETGLMTKLRVVRHGSFATSNTTSINDWIDPEKCKMPTLPNLKDYVRLLINKNWMSLRDLSDAFRQIGLAKEDVGYLGYCLFGLYFIDRKQPYGIASAAANCQSFAQIIIWIMNNKKLPKHIRKNILVHIDDFVLATKTKADAILMKKLFDALCKELNIAISHDKDVDVTQKAILYGFEFDLKRKTVGIPQSKLTNLIRFIKLVIKYKFITGRALETLSGKIMHWSQLYKPAKSLCYNMVSFIHKTLRKHKHYRTLIFRLPDCVINDLKFWLKYVNLIKDVPMYSIIKEPSIEMIGSSDACNTGGGFVVKDIWAFYVFKEQHLNLQIDEKEAHAVIMLLHNLRRELTGRKLILYVDNSVLFYAMSRHWAGERMMPCIYEICLLMMKYRISVWFEWIPTECNKLADTLSRTNTQEFWEWVKFHNLEMRPNPKTLYYVNEYNFTNM